MSGMQSRPLSAPLLLVPRRILATIVDQRFRYLPLETGGFLIGYRRGVHLEVIDITLQEREDVATPMSFSREGGGHANKVERAWKGSARLQSVVGDWHSHPRGRAEPSSTDLKAWKQLARACTEPIVGIIAAHGEVRAFWVEQKFMGVRAFHLSIVEDGLLDVAYGREGRR